MSVTGMGTTSMSVMKSTNAMSMSMNAMGMGLNVMSMSMNVTPGMLTLEKATTGRPTRESLPTTWATRESLPTRGRPTTGRPMTGIPTRGMPIIPLLPPTTRLSCHTNSLLPPLHTRLLKLTSNTLLTPVIQTLMPKRRKFSQGSLARSLTAWSKPKDLIIWTHRKLSAMHTTVHTTVMATVTNKLVFL